MTNDRTRTGDWDRTEWEGETPDHAVTPREDGASGPDTIATSTGRRWQKTQWPGDQGAGPMPPMDPDAMPEGETGLSGDRHAPSEQHWARGQSRDAS
jgi:hypothetical protein